MIDLLVIEPSMSVRKTLERLLEMYGYTMRGVGRGSDALTQISRQRPDLVLSEVDVPDVESPDARNQAAEPTGLIAQGTGGLALCQYFKLAGLPVLLMSTQVTEQLQEASLKAGALELLSKPLTEQVLLSRLSHHLKLPTPTVPLRIQADPTLLSTLMTRPGILGAGLFGANGETLEQVGRTIPASLYRPFLAQVSSTFPVPFSPVPFYSASSQEAAADVSTPQHFQSAQELQCAQLEFPNHCLLIFRLTGDNLGSSAQSGLSDGPSTLNQPSTLVCLIQNNSYASLIKYHLRSSPFAQV
jgi:CheY-like chemotaxis protein